MNLKSIPALFPALILGLLMSVQAADAQSRRGVDDSTSVEQLSDFDTAKDEGPVTMEAGFDVGDDDDQGGFGSKIAGTYLDIGEVGGGAFTGMQTLGAGGSQTATNSNCCGIAGNLQGPAHGAWKRTGPKQITINSVIQIFDLDGTAIITARVQVVVDFLTTKFDNADASLTTELFFWPTPGDVATSPNVETDTPNLVVCGTATWTRLKVTQDAGEDCVDPCLNFCP